MIVFGEKPDRYSLYELQEEELASLGLELELPGLADFMASIRILQEAGGRGRSHRYLHDLVSKNYFEFVSPVTGRRVRSGSSLILDDKTTIFSVPEEPEIVIAAGDLSLGYPICAAFLLKKNILVKLCRSDWGFSERHIPRFNAMIERISWTPGPVTGDPVLVFGDANFAHHSWNQLSALEDIAAGPRHGPLKAIVTQQPLGAVEKIFPEFSDWEITAVHDAELENMNAPGRLFIPAGGKFLTRTLRDRILREAEARVGAECKILMDEIADVTGPILWLSIRTRNRTATNQHEMLLGIATAFLAAAPTGAILVDGFSISADHEECPSYQQAEAASIVREDARAAEELREAILRGQPSARVYTAIGYRIPDSIVLAGKASIYFCHHGTVQHKIGWFHPAPGVVHCNRAMLNAAPAHWVSEQSEIATVPMYIPLDCVVDGILEKRKVSEFSSLLNHEDYTIVDIPAVTRFFLDCAKDSGVGLNYDSGDAIIQSVMKQSMLDRVIKRIKSCFP